VDAVDELSQRLKLRADLVLDKMKK
jgi:hypothetical protein